MSYKITAGISEANLKLWLKEALSKYGLYQGQGVNFTDADIAPVVMCTVIYKNEILLVKRGYGLADAEGYWSTVNGFIDEIQPVKSIVKKEIKEELGLEIKAGSIKIGQSYTLQNPKEKRRYIVFPCLASFTYKPKITLDREHTHYKWITRNKLNSYHILDDLPYTIDKALELN